MGTWSGQQSERSATCVPKVRHSAGRQRLGWPFRDPDGHRFSIRIGLHAGPVVNGVIGTRKMACDVWDDTVNVASRLESTWLPEHIQVTAVVVEKLAEHFIFERRGTIEIRGVGDMETFFLTGRKSA